MSMIVNPYVFAALASDPNFANVVLLCHFDGSDGSTTFTDEKGHTLTAVADAQIDTAQSKWGGASGLFDGTGDRVTAADSADWDFGAGDFTIEAWVRFNNTTGFQIFASQYNNASQRAWEFRKDDTGNLAFFYSTDGGAVNVVTVTGTWGPTTGQWYYVAAKRATTTLSVWADGVQVASGSAGTDTIHNSTTLLRIGNRFSTTEQLFFNGWMDDLRITKGVARDVSVVPTAAFPNS